MKQYIVDTNVLFAKLYTLGKNRLDITVLEDIVDEINHYPERFSKLIEAGVQVVSPEKKHFEKLKEVLISHGANTKLIRLYSNEGKADVILIAFILAEKEHPSTLFEYDYVLVSNDKAVRDVASGYGIECIKEIPISP